MFNEATLAEVRKVAMRARAQVRDRATKPAPELPAVVAAAEASAAAFALGCADGRSSGDGTAALWTGIALHAFSFFSGDESRVAAHARALGTGALAACAYRHGLAAGEALPPSFDPRAARVMPCASTVTMELTVARLTVTARR
jgi:hypothetical protein